MKINAEVLKTPSGCLKMLQLILGSIVMGIIGYSASLRHLPFGWGLIMPYQMLFLMLVAFAFLVTSFLLLVSLLIENSAETIGKSMFEVMYHMLGFLLYLAASIAMIIYLYDFDKDYRSKKNSILVPAAVGGLLNSLAYAVSTIVACSNSRLRI